MKDASGTVIYVGKAKNLRRRVSSYFHKSRKRRRYIEHMIRRIREIEVLIVNNETESLILETNLIRRYRPDTNRAKMHWTSGYPYIVLTKEQYPRFVPFRKFRVNRDLGHEGLAIADKRFGPYLTSEIRDKLLDFVNENFHIRTCYPLPKSVCLRHHFGICGGICAGKETDLDYQAKVDDAVRFLTLKHTHILREMREKMIQCAEDELYIRARKIRDQLLAIDSALEKQIVEREVEHDEDVIWFGEDKQAEYALVMSLKQGMLWEMQLLKYRHESKTDVDSAKCFLRTRYSEHAPGELIIHGPRDLLMLGPELALRNGYRVQMTMPKRGIKAHLLQLCQRNFTYRWTFIKS